MAIYVDSKRGTRTEEKVYMTEALVKQHMQKMLIYDLIIVIYELSQAAFLAWIFVKLIRDSLIPDESFTVVLLVIMAVCAYALSGGVECRARGIRGSIFSFVLIPLAAMLLFALSDVRLDYLMIKDRVGVDFGIADIFCGRILCVCSIHFRVQYTVCKGSALPHRYDGV